MFCYCWEKQVNSVLKGNVFLKGNKMHGNSVYGSGKWFGFNQTSKYVANLIS